MLTLRFAGGMKCDDAGNTLSAQDLLHRKNLIKGRITSGLVPVVVYILCSILPWFTGEETKTRRCVTT